MYMRVYVYYILKLVAWDEVPTSKRYKIIFLRATYNNNYNVFVVPAAHR